MSRYLYYPGCSMEGSGRSYRESLEGICEPLGITLEEINDWNCCGATEYVSLSTTPAYAMIARNLAIAAGEKKADEPLVAACSACYLNLAKADHYMGAQPALNARVNDALGAGGLPLRPGHGQGPPPPGSHPQRRRSGCRQGRGQEAADRAEGGAVPRLHGPAARRGRRLHQSRAAERPRPPASRARRRGGRLPAQDRVLRWPHDPGRAEGRPGAHPTPGGRGRAARGRDDGHGLPDVPDQHRRLPGRDERHVPHQAQDADRVLHPADGVAFGLEPDKVGVGREYTNASKVLAKALKAAPELALAAAAAPVARRPRPDKRALPMPRMADSEVEE